MKCSIIHSSLVRRRKGRMDGRERRDGWMDGWNDPENSWFQGNDQTKKVFWIIGRAEKGRERVGKRGSRWDGCSVGMKSSETDSLPPSAPTPDAPNIFCGISRWLLPVEHLRKDWMTSCQRCGWIGGGDVWMWWMEGMDGYENPLLLPMNSIDGRELRTDGMENEISKEGKKKKREGRKNMARRHRRNNDHFFFHLIIQNQWSIRLSRQTIDEEKEKSTMKERAEGRRKAQIVMLDSNRKWNLTPQPEHPIQTFPFRFRQQQKFLSYEKGKSWNEMKKRKNRKEWQTKKEWKKPISMGAVKHPRVCSDLKLRMLFIHK